MNARDKEDLSFEEYQRDIESSHKRVTTLVNMIRETGEARVEHLTTLESLATGLISKHVDMRTLPDLSPSERAAIAVESGNFWAAITVGGGLAILIGGILNYFFGSSSGGGGGGGGGSATRLPEKMEVVEVLDNVDQLPDIAEITTEVKDALENVTVIGPEVKKHAVEVMFKEYGIPNDVAGRALQSPAALEAFINDKTNGLFYYMLVRSPHHLNTPLTSPLLLGATTDHRLTIANVGTLLSTMVTSLPTQIGQLESAFVAANKYLEAPVATRHADYHDFVKASGWDETQSNSIVKAALTLVEWNNDNQTTISSCRTNVTRGCTGSPDFNHAQFKSMTEVRARFKEVEGLYRDFYACLDIVNKKNAPLLASMNALSKTIKNSTETLKNNGGEAARLVEMEHKINHVSQFLKDSLQIVLAVQKLTNVVSKTLLDPDKKGKSQAARELSKAYHQAARHLLNLAKTKPTATNP